MAATSTHRHRHPITAACKTRHASRVTTHPSHQNLQEVLAVLRSSRPYRYRCCFTARKPMAAASTFTWGPPPYHVPSQHSHDARNPIATSTQHSAQVSPRQVANSEITTARAEDVDDNDDYHCNRATTTATTAMQSDHEHGDSGYNSHALITTATGDGTSLAYSVAMVCVGRKLGMVTEILIQMLPMCERWLLASVTSSIYVHGDNTASVGVRPECGGCLALLHDSCLYVPLASRWCILIISLLDVVCFYDWLISLDQEVALIYPAPWNVVKAAYLFCRYYPMAIAPFHIWGIVGNHEQRVCESVHRVIYACSMPTILSAQFILMLRTYAFSGRKTRILVALSITYLGLAGDMIWVLSKELTLMPLFSFTKRNACFSISDEPNITVPAAGRVQGNNPLPILYHMGVLVTFFDCLNMLIVFWHWVRGRDTFGSLGKSFLKQGKYLYAPTWSGVIYLVVVTQGCWCKMSSTTIQTTVNQLGLAIAHTWCSVVSVLACRLVLMLRQKASPTETKLRLELSHMVDDALEMIAMERCSEEISEGFTIHLNGC
ncbi:hypothetical protein EDB84DRAFT_1676476 [Lactarius hengduanensis]|nr:hypothetical protein EDB84DRAFT_1676476 [Lactarius hengduanensis]